MQIAVRIKNSSSSSNSKIIILVVVVVVRGAVCVIGICFSHLTLTSKPNYQMIIKYSAQGGKEL
jgi:hypothetical protein